MRILDTTLRDGLMTDDIDLSLEDKIQIAALLDRAGIEILEIAHSVGGDLQDALKIGRALSAGKACVLTDTDPANLRQAIDFARRVKGSVVHIYSMANVATGMALATCMGATSSPEMIRPTTA